MNTPRFVYIEGQDGLVRDTHSFGVINLNTKALEEAKRRKEEAMRRVAESQRQQREFEAVKQQVSELQGDVTEMKSMLAAILQKL